MMQRLSAVFCAALAVFILFTATTASATSVPLKPKLEGEWKVTYVRYTAPGADWTIDTPAPVLAVFGKTFYSISGVPEANRPEDLIPFVGTAGTYEVEGEHLVLHPTIDDEQPVNGETVTYGGEMREVNGHLYLTYQQGDATVVVRMTRA